MRIYGKRYKAVKEKEGNNKGFTFSRECNFIEFLNLFMSLHPKIIELFFFSFICIFFVTPAGY